MAENSQIDESGIEIFRLSYNASMRSDSDPSVIPVMDSNNVVLNPDKTGFIPRNGTEIRGRYIPSVGADRKAILVETNPPDVSNGQLLMIVNSKNGLNIVEQFELVKVPEDLNNDTAGMAMVVEFLSASAVTAIGGSVNVTLYRTGRAGLSGTVRLRSFDGTTSPTNPIDQLVSFGAGEFKKTITINGIGDDEGIFYLNITDPSKGVAIGLVSRITVIVEETPSVSDAFMLYYNYASDGKVYANFYMHPLNTIKGVVLEPTQALTGAQTFHYIRRFVSNDIPYIGVLRQYNNTGNKSLEIYLLENIVNASNDDSVTATYAYTVDDNTQSFFVRATGQIATVERADDTNVVVKVRTLTTGSVQDTLTITSFVSSLGSVSYSNYGSAFMRSNWDASPYIMRDLYFSLVPTNRTITGTVRIVKYFYESTEAPYIVYRSSDLVPYDPAVNTYGTTRSLPSSSYNYGFNEVISSVGDDACVNLTGNAIVFFNTKGNNIVGGGTQYSATYSADYDFATPIGFLSDSIHISVLSNVTTGKLALFVVDLENRIKDTTPIVGGTLSGFSTVTDGTFNKTVSYTSPFDRFATTLY